MTKTLLVADDSITIQKIVALTFSDEDVIVESALNGDEALQKVRSLRPDIVLADVFMPGRNGYELCAEIKSDPALCKTPVILLVGTFEPFDSAEAVRVKCDAHISKPFDTSEITQLVHSFSAQPPLEPAICANDDGSHLEIPQNRERENQSLVSEQARRSFIGSSRILDVFDDNFCAAAQEASPPESNEVLDGLSGTAGADPAVPVSPSAVVPSAETEDPIRSAPHPAAEFGLSDEILNYIVEQVVRRMSRDVVREVAWEVIPELSEAIVRQYLDERGLQGVRSGPVSHTDSI